MGPGSSGSGAWSMTTMVVYSPNVGLSSTRMCRAARSAPPAGPAGHRSPRVMSRNVCASYQAEHPVAGMSLRRTAQPRERMRKGQAWH